MFTHSHNLLKYYIFLLLLLLSSQMAFAEDDTGYTIRKIAYEATVHTDDSWTVTETVDVDFSEECPEFILYAHELNYFGLEHFPYRFEMDSLSVEGDEDIVVKREIDNFDNFTIGISRKGAALSGTQHYVVQYKLHHGGHEQPYAEKGYMMYRAILPGVYSTEIAEFSFDIKFDDPLPADYIKNIKVYSGSWDVYNSNYIVVGNECNVTCNVDSAFSSPSEGPGGDRVTGHASHIKPEHTLAIYAPVPEGCIPPEHKDNILAWVFAGLATVCFITIFVMHLRSSRRRSRQKPVVTHTAPDGFNSAEVGYVIDNSVDVCDLNSLIVWWATNGYVKIRETLREGVLPTTDKSYTINIIKLRNLPDDAPEYQKSFWQVFFADGDTCCINDLSDKHEEISAAQMTLGDVFSGKRRLVEFNGKMAHFVLLFLLCGVATMVTSNPSEIFDADMLFPGALWSVSLSVVYAICLLASYTSASSSFGKVVFKGFLMVAVVCLSIFLYSANPHALIFLEGWLLIPLVSSIILNTPYRQQILPRILGLREFIRSSDASTLQSLVDTNPTLYYDVLPYAMAFGLTDEWLNRFRGIALQLPAWYETDYVEQSVTWSPVLGHTVAQRLNTNFAHVIEKEIEVSSLSPSSSIKQRHLHQRELSRLPIDDQFKGWVKEVSKTLLSAILTAIIFIIVRLILANQ